MVFPISCVVLEDEPDQRQTIVECLSTFPELRILGQAGEMELAYRLIYEKQPQAVFMDLKLIGGDGLQLLERLQKHHIPLPYIVIISGYPRRAVDALNDFRHQVVLFIEKPFLENWKPKFTRAVDALAAALHPNSQPRSGTRPGVLSLHAGDRIERIPIREIAWAEVLPGGKSCVVTDSRQVVLNMTMVRFLEQYPESGLQRCSREYAVHKDRILRVLVPTREVVIRYRDGEKAFGIGDAYFHDLMEGL